MAINLGRAMEGDTPDEYPEPDPREEDERADRTEADTWEPFAAPWDQG